MRNSQRVVVGVIGGIAALILAMAIWVRFAVSPAPELSGERTARAYDYADFQGVEVSGQWQVTIERGDAWQVAVEAPAELIESLRVRVEGDALDLSYEGRSWFGDFDGDNALEATITMPALESLEISGTSMVRFSGFDGSTLSLDVSGAGNIRGAASRFDELTLDVSGAVNVELGDVPVTDARVDISGAGNVTLRMAGGRLTGDLSGAANLNYYGTVREESVDTSGFVNVRRRD
jgi:hypothetical protein